MKSNYVQVGKFKAPKIESVTCSSTEPMTTSSAKIIEPIIIIREGWYYGSALLDKEEKLELIARILNEVIGRLNNEK